MIRVRIHEPSGRIRPAGRLEDIPSHLGSRRGRPVVQRQDRGATAQAARQRPRDDVPDHPREAKWRGRRRNRQPRRLVDRGQLGLYGMTNDAYAQTFTPVDQPPSINPA